MNLTKVVIAGHVDHGKSTLIGKILNDTSNILEDRYKKIQDTCSIRKMKFEYAFLLDAFEEEQKQGITIDKLEIPFKYQNLDFLFIDTPGHKEFINNMVSGSTNAEIAFVLVDAQEGVKEQTAQHLNILKLFGIEKVILLVNKMDLVEYKPEVFNNITADLSLILNDLKFKHQQIIPVSAYFGENILEQSKVIKWYNGPSLIESLIKFKKEKFQEKKLSRICIQDIYKFDDKRIYAGIVLSGEVKSNSPINFIQSNIKTEIKSFETWPEISTQRNYRTGDTIAFTLKDSIFITKGEIGTLDQNVPHKESSITSDVFWFSKILPDLQKAYILKIANQKHDVKIVKVEKLSLNIYRLSIESKTPIVFDYFEECRELGRLVILNDFEVVAAGTISQLNANNTIDMKSAHKPFALWLTGRSGSGKTTIAYEFKKEFPTSIVLDGDELRSGINHDLGFSKEDRLKQASRTAHLAKLLLRQGQNVIISLITPYEESRDEVRKILSDFEFVMTYIDVPENICKSRDIKNLYKHSVQTSEFSIDNFEEPHSVELVIDNYHQAVEQNTRKISLFIHSMLK
jgi:bifunctional enzyme CysN/CysC